ERALAKLPADRFATGLEFSEALTPPYAPTEAPLAPAGARVSSSPRQWWRDMVPWAVAVMAIVLAAFLGSRPTTVRKVVRYQLVLPDSARLRTSDGTTVTLS